MNPVNPIRPQDNGAPVRSEGTQSTAKGNAVTRLAQKSISENLNTKTESKLSFSNLFKREKAEKLVDLKIQYNQMAKANPRLGEIGNQAFSFLGPMIRMSPSFEEKFYQYMILFFKDPEHAESFSKFIDANKDARAAIFEGVLRPNGKFDPAIYSSAINATFEMKMICGELDNKEALKFVETINDFCTGANTQPFTDYIVNPVVREGDAGFIPIRAKESSSETIAHDPKAGLLNQLHYYRRNDLEYTSHDLSEVLHRNEAGIPDRVKYTVGRAILGAKETDIDMVDTTIDLDLRGIPMKDAQESRAVFDAFKALANNFPTNREKKWDEIKETLDFLDKDQLSLLKERFSSHLGKNGEWGEVDRKLVALIFVSSSELRGELVAEGLINDRSEAIRSLGANAQQLDREVYSFLLKLDVKDRDRLFGQINAYLGTESGEKLADFLKAYIEKRDDVIQKRDALMNDINSREDRHKYTGISRFALELV